MIITRISGGLGNQMFQYAIAKAIAKRNSDIFKMDTLLFNNKYQFRYQLSLLKIENKIATSEECATLYRKENILSKIMKRIGFVFIQKSSYKKEKQNPFFEEEIYNLSEDCYLDGVWQNEKYFEDIRDDIIKDFTPKQELSKEAQIFYKNIQNTNSISIHIRRGDYITNGQANSVHGVSSLDYYTKAISTIKSKVSNPVFYIFSDDIEWCKENFNFIKNIIFVDNTNSALEDLELMKNCKHNIIANSTFSWWGAWLNMNKEKIVISPKIWFRKYINLNVACDNWIKL